MKIGSGEKNKLTYLNQWASGQTGLDFSPTGIISYFVGFGARIQFAVGKAKYLAH